MKPLLYAILGEGVDSKQDLIEKWTQITGFRPTSAQMNGWLDQTGLASVFGAPKRFQINQEPTYDPYQYPQPQQQVQVPAVAPGGPRGPGAPVAQDPYQGYGQALGGPPSVPGIRRAIPRIPNHDPIEADLMQDGITPVVPGMSRRPGSPPMRTAITPGGPVQVPPDFFA